MLGLMRRFTTLATNPAAVPSKSDKLALYRSLIRTSRSFSAYNFREYIKRRTADAFRANRSLNEPNQIRAAYEDGLKELTVAQRQGPSVSWWGEKS
ncbi:hypothetical protein BC829DRAFT_212797 [Chytridium lagenaria]|nr:hypothetical protein BC829DRAFT_212797 [Chytridium lagenaria]